MLTVNGVSVRFGKRSLYEDVNLKFNKGCCYGIIVSFFNLSNFRFISFLLSSLIAFL